MKKVVLCFAILVAMCLQYAVAADFESKDLKLYNNNAGISLGATVPMPPAGVSPKGRWYSPQAAGPRIAMRK